MEVGKNIRYYREQACYSQRELADLIFVSERTIGHYETETRLPPVDKLALIADALELEITDLFNRHQKTPNDWFYYFFRDGEGIRKNINERRFHIMMKRTRDTDVYEENEEFIKIDERAFPKVLAKQLLPFTNDYLKINNICFFTNYERTRGSDNGLVVTGYIHDEEFEIHIQESYGSSYIMNIMEPYDPEMRLCLEVKQFAEVINEWFLNQHPNVKLQYSINAFIYLFGEDNDTLLKRHVSNPPIFTNHHIMQAIRKKNVKTIEELLQTTYEELDKYHIGQINFSVIEDFKNRIKKVINDKTFHSFCVPKKTLWKTYDDILDTPVEEIFTNQQTCNLLRRHSFRRLGEVVGCYKRELLYFFNGKDTRYPVNKDDLEEMIMELQTYGLSLKEGEEDEWE